MRLLLRAGFDRFTGYGNDAVDMAIWLEKAGADVVPMPTTLMGGLPREFTRLLEKDPRGAVDTLLAFGPPDLIKPWEIQKIARKTVGYSMWERTPLLRADLPGKDWRKHTGPAWAGLDEFWVTCPMNVEAFRNVDAVTPMKVQPCGIAGDDWPVARRDPRKQVTFLMVGMLNGRKDPFAMLETWRDLCRDWPDFDARLVLHTLAPGLHPAIANGAYGRNVVLSDRPLDRDGLLALYRDAHVLVSTSRGEGNNKPAMEFMASGGTVIATDWGGHQNWLHPEVSWPVPGTLQPAEGRPEAEEFIVDRAALRKAILQAWEDPTKTSMMGQQAAVWIRQTMDWEIVAKQMMSKLWRLQ